MRRCFFFAVALGALAQAPEPAIRADVNLVPITFSATDGNGAPIRDLRRSELKLTDDQRPREITFFGQESDLPLTAGLVLDMSNSLRTFFKQHREDMKKFLKNVLQPGDRAFLMSFGVMGRIKLVTDLTGSAEELGRGVEAIEQCNPFNFIPFSCRSPIWGAVFTAARSKMKNVTGRKALVLLSDGLDTGGHTLTEAIEAAQGADTAVYVMMSQLSIEPLTLLGNRIGKARLRRLAEETGGRYFDASKKDTAAGIFAEIEEDLRNLYVVGFSVPEGDRDGKFHPLKIETTRLGVKIRARKGYIAGR